MNKNSGGDSPEPPPPPGQKWDADRYARTAGYVAERGRPLLALLAPQAGERVLDLGCGTGLLTAEIAAAGADVLGIDSDSSMVAAARERGVDARLVEAGALAFSGEFDAVFSNAVLHWIPDHRPVLDNVHRALRAGGRFVGEFGGQGNIAAIITCLTALARQWDYDPRLAGGWNFPAPETFAEALHGAGFVDVHTELIHRPTPLPQGIRAWIENFRITLLDSLAERRTAFLDEAEKTLAPALLTAEGWFADYVRLRFSAKARKVRKTADDQPQRGDSPAP